MPPRIVLLGSDSSFTAAAMRGLAARGLAPFALVRPRRVPGVTGVREVRPFPGAASAPPVFEVGQLGHADAVALLERLAPELIVVACHPFRLPPSWLAAPALGCWNIHPSLLPAYRGPVPVFWQLRAGESRTGVTVHRMDRGLDTGPLLAQRAVPFPAGAAADELDALLAGSGASLVADLLVRGGAVATPQDEAHATRQGFPQEADLEIDASWPARRAFDFLRGAAAWGPFRIVVGARTLSVAEALAFHDAPAAALAGLADGEALLDFPGGSLRVRLAQ